MKTTWFVILMLLFQTKVFGEVEKVKGNIAAKDSAKLSIINIYPDSFPNVSVVFKIEDKKGNPLWGLKKSDLQVDEDKVNCQIVSLYPISENKAINIGIVIDHSGSMYEDLTKLYDAKGKAQFYYDSTGNLFLPKGYVPPLDIAKKAVNTFVKSFDNQKDYISIIGFSSKVDVVLPLSQDVAKISKTINSMKAEDRTALYDAIIRGIEEVKDAEGINVIVVLTDGKDNESKSNWKKVVKDANNNNIPVYIIGFGDVNKNILKKITDATNGQFYYSKNSTNIGKVYQKISEQIQAFYNLVYVSNNISKFDTLRNVELSFEIDSLDISSKNKNYRLPAEVITYLEEKEAELLAEIALQEAAELAELNNETKGQQYLIYGGIATVLLLSAGTMLMYYRKTNSEIKYIQKIYPNPVSGIVNIELNTQKGQLVVVNQKGQNLKTIPINSPLLSIDFSEFSDGHYFIHVQDNNVKSKSEKLIVKR
jgi:Ca-activated chloride channel homolog